MNEERNLPDQRAPEDLRHAAERALEWAAKYPLGGGMDVEVSERVYQLLYPLVDPARGKYRVSTTPPAAEQRGAEWAQPRPECMIECALARLDAARGVSAKPTEASSQKGGGEC